MELPPELLEIEEQRERIAAALAQHRQLIPPIHPSGRRSMPSTLRREQRQRHKTDLVRTRLNGGAGLLGATLHNTYGPHAVSRARDNYDPPSGHTTEYRDKSTLLPDMMEQRRLERRIRNQQNSEKIALLNDHRRQLIHQQKQLREEKRRVVGGWHTPSVASIPGDDDVYKYPYGQTTQSPVETRRWGKLHPLDTPPSSRSPYMPYPEDPVESIEEVVEKVKRLIPSMEQTVQELKMELNREDLKFARMYDGSQGLESYEPHQRDTVVICRSIINEIVEKSMDSSLRQQVPPEIRVLREEEWTRLGRELHQYNATQSRNRVTELVRDEMLMDAVDLLQIEVINEYNEVRKLANAKSNNLIIKCAEMSSSENQEERVPDDPGYERVNKQFYKLTCDRRDRKQKAETREKLWKHSLPLTLIKQVSEEGEEVAEEVVVQEHDTSVQNIDVSKIKPFEVREKQSRSVVYKRFLAKEAAYWAGIVPKHTSIKLLDQWKGCKSAALSQKHRLLAIGTGHGDVLIYDLYITPPRLLYVYHNSLRTARPVESMVFSLDDTQLAVQRENSIQIFNLNLSTEVDTEELADLGIKIKDTELFKPFSLQELVLLEREQGELMFQSGPLAEREKVAQYPGICKFHPSCTISGTNMSLMMTLENGDVHKLDLESKLMSSAENPAYSKIKKTIYHNLTPAGQPNLIGEDIESELFKGHESPIILIGFVSGCGDMVTVDEQGFVFLWRYTKDRFNDMFEPQQKNKLLMEERVFLPVNNSPPKTVFKRYFEDKKTKKQVPIPDDELAELEDKMEMELFLHSVEDHADPVYKHLDNDADTITRLHAPQQVSKTGSEFYLVVRGEVDGRLVRVEKHMLRPALSQATRLIEAELTPDQDVLVYMLLFPAVPPRDAHISFFAYDLEKQENVDMRLDILLTPGEYNLILNSNVCSFETSRPFETTSTAYIVTNILGIIYAYSLTTGSMVMTQDRGEFLGLNLLQYPALPRSFLELPATSSILVASQTKLAQMHVVTFGEQQPNVDIVSLQDLNKEAVRRDMWLAYRTLEQMQPEKIIAYDPDQRLRNRTWTLDAEEYISATTACRTLVMDLVDDAVDQAFFVRARDLEPVPQFDHEGHQITDKDGRPILKSQVRGYPDNYQLERTRRMDLNRQMPFKLGEVEHFYGDQKRYTTLEELRAAELAQRDQIRKIQDGAKAQPLPPK